jgi:hypothetical protein
MPDLEVRKAERRPAKRWVVWLRVLGLVVLGSVLLLVISLPGLASEDQLSGPGVGWFVALAVVVVALVACTYVVVRHSLLSRRPAALIAVAVVPASYAFAGLITWLVVTVSS